MLFRTVCRALEHFLSSTNGGSPVEYAVFAGLTVGLALFGGEIAGAAAQTTFARAASAASMGPGASHAPRKQAEAPRVRLETTTAPAAEPAGDGLLWLKYAACGALLGLGGGVWYVLYARRKATEAEEEQTALDAALPTRNLFRKRQAILKILSLDMSCLLDNRITIGQLMSTKLTTVSPETPYSELEQMMATNGHRHLLVIDQAGKLLGVISDRDIAKKHVATAGELMTANPVTAERSTLIGPAVTLLLERRFSCLPVVENGQLLGLLTTSDLMMALQCSLQLLCKIAMATRTNTQEEAEKAMAA